MLTFVDRTGRPADSVGVELGSLPLASVVVNCVSFIVVDVDVVSSLLTAVISLKLTKSDVTVDTASVLFSVILLVVLSTVVTVRLPPD